MRIWAHRGCSLRYPENTLTAFSKAIEIPGLTGIETDVQLTKDGEVVVFHDEKIDRTTDHEGYVKDYTLAELKSFRIKGEYDETIPTLEELLQLLSEPMKRGFMLNIELKNSILLYEGMEEKVIALIEKYDCMEQIVFSSFYAKSLEKIRRLVPNAKIGMLDIKASDCMYKLRGGCGADAIHPYGKAMDLKKEEMEGMAVRAWFSGYLYPTKPTGKRLDLKAIEAQGITDVFLNEPEVYL